MSIKKGFTEDRPRALGYYWVRIGTEWQVARYHFSGWFLTGVSSPAPDDFIDFIGEPVMDVGTIQVLLLHYRRSRRYSIAALVVALASFTYSALHYLFRIL